VCATGYGIRRSHDLRAEIGKYPISTNERKNMSTKTLRKRIALVAVAALGAGVLSVAPANAADGAIDDVAATGLCATTTASGTYQSIADDSVYIYVALGGTVTTSNDGDGSYTLSASGGGVMTGSGGSATSALAYAVSDDADTAIFTPNAVGTVKISLTADSAPATVADYLYVVTVASCSSSTWSETRSSYETSAAEDSTPDGEAGSTYTFADESTVAISLLGKNTYNALLPLGVWTVSSSNASLVVDIDTSAASIGTLSSTTDSIQADGNEIYVAVEQKDTGTAQSGTITVTYNGATVYSKSVKITGDAAKITVSGVDVQDTANTAAGDFDVTVQDAAGNYLGWTVSGDSTKYNNVVTSVTGGNTTAGDPSGTVSAATWTCNGVSGEATVRVKATTNAATTIYSNDFVAKCGSAAYTYTASLDKALYVPGDIATLTITAKDASGFAPFKGETVDAAAGTPSIAGSQMTPVNTPSAADTFNASGVKTYTFTVGSTAGKYNMAVNLGYTGNSAVAVPYSVASSGGTTNEDVLKAIVSLIASINKQIAALQKALLRR
jgi:hypothetical protein